MRPNLIKGGKQMNLTIIKQNDQFLVDSREVAEMIGREHKEVLAMIEGQKHQDGSVKHVGFLPTISESGLFTPSDFFIESSYKVKGNNKSYKCFLLTKKGCDMVANKMTGEKGVLFTAAYVTKFDQMEKELTLPQKSVQIQSFEMQLIGVQYTSQILRVDETSKILMLEQAHKQHGVATNHLPSYVDAEVTKSLTALLKENNTGIGTAKVNTKLIELGILEIKERPSSKGGTKEFKSLTDAGLKYGKNLLNPRSPKETQPHYYELKFGELLSLIGYVDQKTA